MFRLCLKDFKLNKSIIILTAVIFQFFLFPVMVIVEGRVFDATMFIIIVLLIVLYTDEKHKTETLFCSFFFKRSSFVYAKYLFMLLIVLLGIGLTLLSLFLIKAMWPIGFPIPDIAYGGRNWFSVFFAVGLLMSICFPFYFKYGYGKGLTIGFFAASACGLSLVGLLYLILVVANKARGILFISLGLKELIVFAGRVFRQSALTFGEGNFSIFLSLFLSVLLIISVKLSVRFYKRRDL
ncbi:ABC-2 transporter permease [Acidobacteriota bacterium]